MSGLDPRIAVGSFPPWVFYEFQHSSGRDEHSRLLVLVGLPGQAAAQQEGQQISIECVVMNYFLVSSLFWEVCQHNQVILLSTCKRVHRHGGLGPLWRGCKFGQALLVTFKFEPLYLDIPCGGGRRSMESAIYHNNVHLCHTIFS